MTLTIQMEQKNPAFLDALKKFVSQWQGVKIETQHTQDAESQNADEFDYYISDEELLSDPETLEAAKECEYIIAHPEEYKKFGSAREMFEALDNE